MSRTTRVKPHDRDQRRNAPLRFDDGVPHRLTHCSVRLAAAARALRLGNGALSSRSDTVA
jgi:hypothetical protein